MYPLPSVGLEDDGGVAGVLVVGLRVVEGERREDDADADLEPLVDREVGSFRGPGRRRTPVGDSKDSCWSVMVG